MIPRLARDESGFSLIELVIVMGILTIVVAGLSNLFVSGLRTSATTNSMLASQTDVKVALDRLEYETRCASQATLLASGAGVTLTLPSQCSHATGTYSWCVASGDLVRYSGTACSGSGETLANDVTSATPFSCVATVGDYPQLQVALTADNGSSPAAVVSQTDDITMRNATPTTSGSAACS